jgi:hypothetical protein
MMSVLKKTSPALLSEELEKAVKQVKLRMGRLLDLLLDRNACRMLIGGLEEVPE